MDSLAEAPAAGVTRAAARRRWLTLVTVLVLGGLLAAGAVLRLYHLNWDSYQHIHPDERFIVWVADTMHWPQDLGTALDPLRSPLNPFRWPPGAGELAGKPRDYAYGHFPLYLLILVAHGLQYGARALAAAGLALPAAWQHLAEYAYLDLVGRVISTVADLGTLLLVFWLARHLYCDRNERSEHGDADATGWRTGGGLRPWLVDGTAAGLLAAGTYAVAVLPVQLSHFVAVDQVLTFCVVACVVFAVRAAERGGRWTWLAAGALAGLAVGTKFTAVLLFVPLVVAALCRLPDDAPGSPGPVAVILRRLAVVGAAALVVFLVTNPFAALEPRAYLRNMLAQNAMVSGVIDAPYMRQYAGTAPYGYLIQQISQWGLGWPLGLAAWGGLAWAVAQAGRRRVTAAQVVALAWALPYFAVTGPLYAKFLRYMAPLLPFLLVFGAGAFLAFYRTLVARWPRRGKVAWTALLVVGALLTLGWTLAFTGVYRQEHPWLQASRWIYTHIPDGDKLLTEHWDDALPLAMDEIPDTPPRRVYRQVELPLFDPDDQAKLDGLVAELSSADYIILASNRLAGPIQRLPLRYPMSSQYYRLLFSGDLGYTQVAEFTAYPRLGGLVIPDDHADESFSVYDHPHVRIFANTARLSSSALRTRLNRYLPLPAPGGMRPPGLAMLRPPPQAPAPAAPLTLAQPVDTLPVVADFRWNQLAGQYPALAVALWWLALSLLGWAAWPLLYPLLGGLADRGYGLARLAGWLLLGWVHWLGVSLGLWQNRAGVLALLLALLVAGGSLAWFRQRGRITAFLAERGRLLLAEEVVFAAVFLIGVGFRLFDPDLWQPWNGGEKFMDFAFLNAILRSAHFPPYDPYFAGGIINYYYYGLYLVSLAIKLTGIAPEVAFNLAVPGLFALTALALFGVGASLAARRRAVVGTGLLAVLLGLWMGNLASFQQVLGKLAQLGERNGAGLPWVRLLAIGRGLGALLRGASWPNFDYWAASRVIPSTINEFPFWSFLFADLHPHLIAMPIGVAAVGLALNWLMTNGAVRGAVAGQTAGASVGQVEPGDGLPEPAVPQSSEDGQQLWDAAELPATASEPVQDRAELPGTAAAWVDPVDEAEDPLTAPGPVLPDHESSMPGDATANDNGEGVWMAKGAKAGAPFPVGGDTEDAKDWDGGELTEPDGAGMADTARALSSSQARDPSIYATGTGAGRVWAAADATLAPADYGPPVPPAQGPAAGKRLALALNAARLLLFVIVLGALGPTNTWDLPVYLLLAAGAFWLAAWRGGRRASALEGLVLAIVAGGLAVLAYAPFYLSYHAQVGGQSGPLWARYLGLIHAASPMQPWLTIWFCYLFVAYSFLLWALFAGRGQASRNVIALLVAVGAVLVLLMAERPTAALAILPLVLALVLLFRRSLTLREGMVLLLLFLGLGILAGTEIVYLRDFLEGGDWYRMNTVFKFAMPAWLLLGLAGSTALPRVWSALDQGPPWLRATWRLLAVGLLGAGLFFVAFGVPAVLDDRFPGPRPALGVLDGTAYMTVGRYAWPDEQHTIQLANEYQAIHWLLDHVTGTPVIAEAPAGEYVVDGAPAGYDYYRAGGLRVASLTGFPTFLGQHQYEQRPGDEVGPRAALGQEFFETTDLPLTRALLAELRVDYVYIGTLERLLFPAGTLAKFDQMVGQKELEVVYRNPDVTIYRVLR